MAYEVSQCYGARLRRISRIVDGYYRKCIIDHGVTENQLTILFVLNKMGLTEQGKIGQRLVLERSTVSRNVKLLLKKELITKTNAYRPKIELTVKGKNLVKTLLPIWEEIMDELSLKLGGDGIQLIKELELKLK